MSEICQIKVDIADTKAKLGRVKTAIPTDFPMLAAPWLMSGQVKDRVDVAPGLEHAVDTLQRLFTSANTGKLLVQIGAEP